MEKNKKEREKRRKERDEPLELRVERGEWRMLFNA